MQVTSWDIYWITRLDSISVFLNTVSGIGLGFIIIFGVFGLMAAAEGMTQKDVPKFFRVLYFSMFAITPLCFIGQALTPTTKEMCAIIVVPKIVNNEEIQGLGSDIVELARDWMQELKPKEEVK